MQLFKKEFRHLIPRLTEILPEHISIKDHKKSFSLQISSNVIDRTGLFEEQIEDVRNGLDNLFILRDWLINNYIKLDKF